MEYDAGRRLFRVRYDASRAAVADMLASVRGAGKRTGRDYLPEVVAQPAGS